MVNEGIHGKVIETSDPLHEVLCNPPKVDIGQTLTRHFHVNTTVQGVFTGNKLTLRKETEFTGKQSIIINNNKSSSEQMIFKVLSQS